jgi:hypothetical protein
MSNGLLVIKVNDDGGVQTAIEGEETGLAAGIFFLLQENPALLTAFTRICEQENQAVLALLGESEHITTH